MTELKRTTKPHKAMLAKCPTGIQGLDEITDGDYLRGVRRLFAEKQAVAKR
jgi:hypothetical protein